ncbi:MAG: indole-3-glycerol phosphate synthase TrpC [Acidobacteriales bacterium]|nr:indole-3-glycerol phosphate synthase TrpC [Terriglobales bacterium]
MTTLQEILDSVRADVEARKRAVPLGELARQAERLTRSPRRLKRALEAESSRGTAVIAELKQASPSKGMIRGTFPVGRLALSLLQGGASALSVLTEEKYFHGSLQNLREASAATGLPCLRKDFIVDEYQLLEAATNSADAVLLIAAALPDPEYSILFRRARELNLDALCEVHDETELSRTIAIGAEIIGVNSRDLKTMEVDEENPIRLAAKLPPNAVKVAESGIKSADDIRRLRAAGYQAFLIGEALMRQEDPGAALAQMIAQAKAPPIGSSGVAGWSAGTKD